MRNLGMPFILRGAFDKEIQFHLTFLLYVRNIWLGIFISCQHKKFMNRHKDN